LQRVEQQRHRRRARGNHLQGGQITGGWTTNSITYTPPPGGPFGISVSMPDYCVTSASASVNVAYGPSALAGGSATIAAGGSTNIHADLTGTPPWNVTWSDSVVQSGITTSPLTRSVSPVSTTTYTVSSVSNSGSCSSYGTSSGSAVITVSISPPASIFAISQADLSIGPSAFRLVSVSWPSAAGASTHALERATSINGAFTTVEQSASLSFTDAPPSSTTPQAYIYRVWSASAGGVRSQSPSPRTFATVASPSLFTDEPVQQNATLIRGIHIGELRRAVDEVRRAAGLTAAWSSYVPATGLVSAASVSTLRTALDAACTAIRGAPCGYAGTAPVSGGLVLAIQLQSTRDAVK
jgi:hypothetical protein